MSERYYHDDVLRVAPKDINYINYSELQCMIEKTKVWPSKGVTLHISPPPFVQVSKVEKSLFPIVIVLGG